MSWRARGSGSAFGEFAWEVIHYRFCHILVLEKIWSSQCWEEEIRLHLFKRGMSNNWRTISTLILFPCAYFECKSLFPLRWTHLLSRPQFSWYNFSIFLRKRIVRAVIWDCFVICTDQSEFQTIWDQRWLKIVKAFFFFFEENHEGGINRLKYLSLKLPDINLMSAPNPPFFVLLL